MTTTTTTTRDGMTTGECAAEIGMTEPYLQALVRSGKVTPPPKVRGRRIWRPKHVAAARAVVVANGAPKR